MNAAEARSVVADLESDADVPKVSHRGQVMREWEGRALCFVAGVHRHGPTPGGGEAQWYETVMEWHGRQGC